MGGIPAWLDEGAACYFESSTLKRDSITTNLSRSNYRINLLYWGIEGVKYNIHNFHGAELKIPSIKEVTNYNWQEFSGKPGDLMIRASFNQSMSYAFVAFLQDINLLSKTMEAFRNRTFNETSPDDVTILRLHTTDELLSNVTGMNVMKIQAAFDQWCKKKNICHN